MKFAIFHYGPAALSAGRLLALPLLIRLAWQGKKGAWSALLAAMVLTDLADGILARRIGHLQALRVQRRLDSLADAPLFLVAPLCAMRLQPYLMRQERRWLIPLAAAWMASTLTAAVKFGQLPRYRTAAFKWSAGLAGGTLAGRLVSPRVPFRVALGLLTVAHLEALAITLLLDAYRTPISGLGQLISIRAIGGADAA